MLRADLRLIAWLARWMWAIAWTGCCIDDLLGQPTARETSTFAVSVDEALPPYEPVAGVALGTIKAVGSDTMQGMMVHWTKEFHSIYPSVQTVVDAKGSSNALPALIQGQANFGLMSRLPKESEITEFKSRYGYEPTVLPTSIDMLAVYVHAENPLVGLQFRHLDAIFSSTRKSGGRERLAHWDQLVSGETYSRPIICFGRNPVSGTYGYFKDRVLMSGDYGPWVNEMASSSHVLYSVARNAGAIGYSGIGARIANVRPIAISSDSGGMVAPTPENAYSGEYPLARLLYLVLNYDARKPLDPMRAEFLRFIYSRDGQAKVVQEGYLPLTAEMAARVLAEVDLTAAAD